MERKPSNRPTHVHFSLRFGDRVQSMKFAQCMFWHIKTEEFVRRERRRIGGRDEHFIWSVVKRSMDRATQLALASRETMTLVTNTTKYIYERLVSDRNFTNCAPNGSVRHAMLSHRKRHCLNAWLRYDVTTLPPLAGHYSSSH